MYISYLLQESMLCVCSQLTPVTVLNVLNGNQTWVKCEHSDT